MNPRQTYHHGDLRASLIKAAFKQLEIGGEESLSLRALAKQAGVSPNAPYRHFADKQALMAAIAADGFTKFADEISACLRPDQDPIAVVRDMGHAYLDFTKQQPYLYHLMFSPYGYSLTSDTCQREAARAFDALTQAVIGAQAAGWQSDSMPHVAVLGYWASLHGWADLVEDKLVPPGVPLPSIDERLSVFFPSAISRADF